MRERRRGRGRQASSGGPARAGDARGRAGRRLRGGAAVRRRGAGHFPHDHDRSGRRRHGARHGAAPSRPLRLDRLHQRQHGDLCRGAAPGYRPGLGRAVPAACGGGRPQGRRGVARAWRRGAVRARHLYGCGAHGERTDRRGRAGAAAASRYRLARARRGAAGARGVCRPGGGLPHDAPTWGRRGVASPACRGRNRRGYLRQPLQRAQPVRRARRRGGAPTIYHYYCLYRPLHRPRRPRAGPAPGGRGGRAHGRGSDRGA